MFAFGSSDGKVRVHSLADNSTMVLAGHKNRVRALHWNTELPYLLISGSDDNQIIGWNVATQQPLFKSYEQSLSLTSFASHPSRPFMLVTSHFDAGIRQWSLLGLPDVALAQLKLLLELPEAASDVKEMKQQIEMRARLFGSESKTILKESGEMH
jgi:WD repeat-containing protein 17